MNALAINAVGDDLAAAAEFCRAEHIGIEVTDFALPGNLDGDLYPLIERNRLAVRGIAPLISHGPFMDLIVTSRDPAIVEVCQRRHRASLEAAHAIGAAFYVAHTNYRPMIRNPAYRSSFVGRMLDFWLPLADWAADRSIVICLENLWEPGPEIQASVVVKAGHPSLKASFDNGHVLVFSEMASSKWIEVLGSSIVHAHFHDNSGNLDEHMMVGEGTEDWPSLIGALRRHAPDAVLVAECGRLEENMESIARIRKV